MRAYPGTFHKDCMRKRRSQKRGSIQMNRRIIAAIAVIIGVAAIGAWVYAGMDKEENKQKVAITELPVAVQKTIQDNPRQSKTILGEERSPKPRKKPKEARPIRRLKSRSPEAKRSRSRSLRTEASSASGKKKTDEMRRCSRNKRGRIPVVNYEVIE